MRTICGTIIAAVMCAASAFGATEKVDLKTGWRFVKADDSNYVCDASISNEIRKLSAILDRADRGDLPAGIDFDWAKPEFDDSSWKEVRVPHDWGVEKPFDSDRAYGDAFLDVTGIGWYRIKFRVESCELRVGDATLALPPNGKVFFECDGAMSYAMLYLDGKFLGGWPYGYTRWRVELTEHLRGTGNGERESMSLPSGATTSRILRAGIPVADSTATAGCWFAPRIMSCRVPYSSRRPK